MKWFEIDNCNRNTHTHTTYAYVKHQCFTHSFVIYVCSLSTCDSWQAAISCHMFSLAVYVQKMYAVLAQIAGKQASKPLDKYTAIDVRSSDLFYNWFINLPSVAISNGQPTTNDEWNLSYCIFSYAWQCKHVCYNCLQYEDCVRNITLLSVNQSYLECRTDHHPHPQPHKSTTNDNNDYKIYNRRAFIHTQTLNLPSILAP